MPNNLTDNEIKKALEDWIKNYDGSYVNFKTLGNALDLINRLEAENESLKNAYKQCAWERDAYIEIENTAIAEAKAEAMTEFAEEFGKLLWGMKNKYLNEGNLGHASAFVLAHTKLQNFLKEMVGNSK